MKREPEAFDRKDNFRKQGVKWFTFDDGFSLDHPLRMFSAHFIP